MSDEKTTTPSETGKAAAGQPDLSKYVPKEEFDKISGSARELEAKLDEAKLSLLDPEYIEFLENKKSGKREPRQPQRQVDDKVLESLTSRELLELAVEQAKASLIPEIEARYEERIRRHDTTLADVVAVLELQSVEKKYKDFDDFRDDTRKVLESSKTPLTIEQAFLLAKQHAMSKDPEKYLKPKETPELKGSEKPGRGIPSEELTREFKSAADAADDAWDRIVGRGKDIL